jgi:type 1 fimbriae regulatory protein FimB
MKVVTSKPTFSEMQQALVASVSLAGSLDPSGSDDRTVAHIHRMHYLTVAEITRLLASIVAPRDHALVLLAYRHGLRVSEVSNLKITDVDFRNATIAIKRIKGSLSGKHVLQADELRILSEYLGSRRDACPALFASNRKTGIKRNQIFNVVERYGSAVGLPKWKCHPHVLRHSIAIHLLSAGVSLEAVRDWMGHANIQSTEIYAKAIAMHHGTEIGRAFLTGKM